MLSLSTNVHFGFAMNPSEARTAYAMLELHVGSLIQMFNVMGDLPQSTKILRTLATDSVI